MRRSPAIGTPLRRLLHGGLAALWALGWLASGGGAQPLDPKLQERIGIDQKLGERLSPDLTFRDSQGQMVSLGQYFGEKPLVLSLVYYECPMLCTQVLNSLVRALNALTFDIGTEFAVLTVSIDPQETPELAAAKKAEYLKHYRGDRAGLGWHFLTGQQEQIEELARAVGFRYQYDAQTDQYIHASGLMVLTPEGRLARYFYGIDYPPRDLRWGLVEAAAGKIGSPVDKLLLMCYSYDPRTGQYGLVIWKALRIGGVATVLILGAFIVVMLRRDHRKAVPSVPLN